MQNHPITLQHIKHLKQSNKMTNTTKPHEGRVLTIKTAFVLIVLLAILGAMLPGCSAAKDPCVQRRGISGFGYKAN